ncbi:MAG: DUF4342 domain-containing protein [Firmicutes bacterium]|nr:DUF4342 domain-containing protein [Bacillota bacterium]
MMSAVEDLTKIDLLRERADLSYEGARRLLEAHDGDVVEALIALEREDRARRRFAGRGSEFLAELKSMLRAANRTKFRIKQEEKTILELPVTAGLVGAILAPELAVLGAAAALFARCTMEVVRPRGGDVQLTGQA